ncbi:MAG TPA: CPBP family intramembrane glutamic endopeptidase [Thermoanaerobaculia bacterium]|nr:CPBP family intramembrane glutamic endopeptidase [Thermoanaerobaculia bacterium]
MGRPPGFLRDLGFLSGPAGTPLAWILALAVAFAYATYTVRNNPLVREHWRALSAAKLLGVTAAVGAAVVEEAFFRRVIMDAVLSAGGGSLVQVVVSGLVFGLAHGVYGIVTGRLAVGLGVMIATGTVGIALGAVYVIGERSLAPVIVSHFIITATIQPGIMYAAFSGQMGRPKKGGGA